MCTYINVVVKVEKKIPNKWQRYDSMIKLESREWTIVAIISDLPYPRELFVFECAWEWFSSSNLWNRASKYHVNYDTVIWNLCTILCSSLLLNIYRLIRVYDKILHRTIRHNYLRVYILHMYVLPSNLFASLEYKFWKWIRMLQLVRMYPKSAGVSLIYFQIVHWKPRRYDDHCRH